MRKRRDQIFQINYWVTYYIYLFQDGNEAQFKELLKIMMKRLKNGEGIYDSLLVMVLEINLMKKV